VSNYLVSSNSRIASNDPGVIRAVEGYRELLRVVSAAGTPEFPEPGVTMAQMRVLMLLAAVGEARMSDLQPKLGVSLSTLSSLVDRLVEANLAQRRDDARDRRSVLVSLTERGVQMLDSFQELGERHLRELLVHLEPGDLETVTRAIDLLVAAARRLTPEDPR
jgi:MarR family transcriptional regulator, organic hydroperoxide resistance regulator